MHVPSQPPSLYIRIPSNQVRLYSYFRLNLFHFRIYNHTAVIYLTCVYHAMAVQLGVTGLLQYRKDALCNVKGVAQEIADPLFALLRVVPAGVTRHPAMAACSVAVCVVFNVCFLYFICVRYFILGQFCLLCTIKGAVNTLLLICYCFQAYIALATRNKINKGK